MHVDRHQRVAGPLNLADQLADFVGVEQQFAGAGRVGMHMGGSLGQRRDVRAQQKQLGVTDDHVGFLDLGTPGPD